MFKDFRTRKSSNKVVNLERAPKEVDPAHVRPKVDAELQAHLELKSRLHEALLDRLNLALIDKVEKAELRRQIAGLVTQLLDQEGVPIRSDR